MCQLDRGAGALPKLSLEIWIINTWVPIWSWDRLNSWEIQECIIFRLISPDFQLPLLAVWEAPVDSWWFWLQRKTRPRVSLAQKTYFGTISWIFRWICERPESPKLWSPESTELWSPEHGFWASVSPKWALSEFFGTGELFTTLHYSPKHFLKVRDVCTRQETEVQNHRKMIHSCISRESFLRISNRASDWDSHVLEYL